MSKWLLGLAIGLVVLLALAAAGVVWWTQDANRLKPQIENLLSDTLEMPVSIDGDIQWQLWPPLFVTVDDLSAEDEDTRYDVAHLTLAVQFADILANAGDWKVESLVLTDVAITSEGETTFLNAVEVSGYKPDAWAEVRANGRQGELAFTGEGEMRHKTSEKLTLDLRNFHITAGELDGTCNGQVFEVREVTETDEPDDAVLPLNTLRTYGWRADCDIPTVSMNGESFADLALTTQSDASVVTSQLTVPDFFAGTAVFGLAQELEPTSANWLIEPRIDNVDPARLMAWLGRPLDWEGVLQVTGSIATTGNTQNELLDALDIDLNFDGGEGEIDIYAIKQQIAALARYTEEAASVEKWPDRWQYRHFVGAWRGRAEQHTLDFALDNLTVLGEGTYNIMADTLDMDASLTFDDNPEYSRFDVNPLLVGLPIPAECRGSLAEPNCRLDESQAMKNVGRALAQDEGALKSKLEEKIEEEVPEQYRDAARTLLDILSGALGDDSE